jgi:hypothetical protein
MATDGNGDATARSGCVLHTHLQWPGAAASGMRTRASAQRPASHPLYFVLTRFFGCTCAEAAATSVAMSVRRRRTDKSLFFGSVDRGKKKKKIEKKMSVTGITTGIAWKKRRTLQVVRRGNSLDWKREDLGDQLAKRVRLREERESQRERVAGERAGGMMPRAWQMEKSLSHR